MQKPGSNQFWKALGPGLLFAGAAVGVSHLVQSTRAGAVFGFALLGLVLLANLFKYPAFRFGPQYAAATGTSLLEGYRRQGRWALILYTVLTAATMFAIQAAVSLVTAGLAKVMLGLTASPIVIAGALMAICGLLIGLGRFLWLDRINKVVVAVLTLSTLLSALLVLPQIDWRGMAFWPDSSLWQDKKQMIFVAALVGWMPSAIDISVWQSLWTLARRRDTAHAPSIAESATDFHIGYLGTVLLALCFIILGAGVFFKGGITPANTPVKFAGQIISLYTQTLGEWSRPVISVCAFAVMFSTTLTVVDGFPRTLTILWARFKGPEEPGGHEAEGTTGQRLFWVALVVMAVGSLIVLNFFSKKSLKGMVDLATVLSFLTAPALAWLNHRAVTSDEVPLESRPSGRMIALSWAGMVFLGGFALYFLWIRFVA